MADHRVPHLLFTGTQVLEEQTEVGKGEMTCSRSSPEGVSWALPGASLRGQENALKAPLQRFPSRQLSTAACPCWGAVLPGPPAPTLLSQLWRAGGGGQEGRRCTQELQCASCSVKGGSPRGSVLAPGYQSGPRAAVVHPHTSAAHRCAWRVFTRFQPWCDRASPSADPGPRDLGTVLSSRKGWSRAAQ